MQQAAGQPQNVAWPSARLPATDIVDEGAELVCQVELPGVKGENVEVSCFGRGLLVTAYSEPEIDLGALVQAERGVETTYRRAINLPVPVQPSGAKATLRDGILTVNLPKANPTEAPRRIPVTSAH
ncbi:MAG TPA: Hsp20/alpha crystallin family protein [Candidatus Thermoplasmatota archaeon]|nr:Hsp20/alpha crystallin family protein [Candidatus Thermoplasmatota archaeon]